MGNFLPIGERLREQREHLGMNQTDFAKAAGVSRKTLFGYEMGERTPDAAALAAWARLGLDVSYVVSGKHSGGSTGDSFKEPVSQTISPSPPDPILAPIDTERLSRIVSLLEAFAKQAGRRWPAERLVAVAAEVYNVLADEPALDEPKVEKILKLVVNR